MGRYIQVDRAEGLEKWVRQLAAETSDRLDGALFYKLVLSFGASPLHTGQVSFDIEYISPDFADDAHKKRWGTEMVPALVQYFKGSPCNPLIYDARVYWMFIPFEEQTEEELYILTPEKEHIIRKGFVMAEEYVKWYCSAVKEYESVKSSPEKMEEFFSRLRDSLHKPHPGAH